MIDFCLQVSSFLRCVSRSYWSSLLTLWDRIHSARLRICWCPTIAQDLPEMHTSSDVWISFCPKTEPRECKHQCPRAAMTNSCNLLLSKQPRQCNTLRTQAHKDTEQTENVLMPLSKSPEMNLLPWRWTRISALLQSHDERWRLIWNDRGELPQMIWWNTLFLYFGLNVKKGQEHSSSESLIMVCTTSSVCSFWYNKKPDPRPGKSQEDFMHHIPSSTPLMSIRRIDRSSWSFQHPQSLQIERKYKGNPIIKTTAHAHEKRAFHSGASGFNMQSPSQHSV